MPKALSQWFIIGQHIIPVCSWSFAAVDDDADIMGHIIMPVIFSPVIECIDWHICIILLGVTAIGCTEASCSAVSFEDRRGIIRTDLGSAHYLTACDHRIRHAHFLHHFPALLGGHVRHAHGLCIRRLSLLAGLSYQPAQEEAYRKRSG